MVMAGCVWGVGRRVARNVAGGVVAAALAASAAAQGLTTVSFDTLPAGAFSSYVEDGFVVTALTSNWSQLAYGAPHSSLVFRTKSDAGISVTHGGDLFQFNSVGLYSSVTTIPYAIRGYLGGQLVFERVAVQPGTQGTFAQVASPSAAFIDQLTVTLTNPMALNPMGLDNLTFGAVSAVPEPPVWLLGVAGFAALAGRRSASSRRAVTQGG